MPDRARFSSEATARLAAVLQTAKGLISIEDAMAALDIDRLAAAKALSRWRQQGWLKRVGRGLYAPIPLDALAVGQVLDDPWILVPALFSPGYVSGWTAAEHWGFTEQIFRSIFVVTAKSIRAREQVVQGVVFTLKRTRTTAIFGTRSLWRGQTRVAIADKHRTILDMLDDPATGGGVRHVDSCLSAYLRDPDCDLPTLIRYAETLGNGAVFKRLGFLVAQRPGYKEFADACQQRLTTGNAMLDPALPSRRLIKKWRLWIPKNWASDASHD